MLVVSVIATYPLKSEVNLNSSVQFLPQGEHKALPLQRTVSQCCLRNVIALYCGNHTDDKNCMVLTWRGRTRKHICTMNDFTIPSLIKYDFRHCNQGKSQLKHIT